MKHGSQRVIAEVFTSSMPDRVPQQRRRDEMTARRLAVSWTHAAPLDRGTCDWVLWRNVRERERLWL